MRPISRADAPLELWRWALPALAAVAAGLLLSAQPANRALFNALNHGLAASPHSLWAGLTVLGSGWPIAMLVLAMDRRSGIGPALLAPCIVLCTLFIRIPRALWYSPRPLAALPHEQVMVIGKPVVYVGSMPSGHTLTAVAGVCMLWFVWSHVRRSAQHPAFTLPLLPLALGFGFAIGLSRVAVGAHWPADVLVGSGLGMLAATLAAALERRTSWAAWFARPTQQRGVALFELGCALVWTLTDTGYPEGAWVKWLVVAVATASGLLRWHACTIPNARLAPPRETAPGS